jgi:transcriptional regulator with XRE-family HTH domain
MASLHIEFATMSLSARLIALRKERGLTQQGLADATGIHVQQIKRYEAGSSEPSAEALRKIARTFAISTDWLLFEEGERAPSDDLALQFEAVQQLSDDERAVIREVVESLIIKYQSRRWDSARPAAPAAKKATARRSAGASR